MNLKDIKEMIKLMNENDLTELEVEQEGTKVKIKKTTGDAPAFVRVPSDYKVETQSSRAPSAESSAANNASGKNLTYITAPMVGTFYRSSAPGSALFIDVGQTVEVGQVVCIIEAMKLMNEIKSEIRGKVVEIPVDNSEPVEFGQKLFGIEPL